MLKLVISVVKEEIFAIMKKTKNAVALDRISNEAGPVSNGISSLRVRSGPSAFAVAVMFRIAFKRT